MNSTQIKQFLEEYSDKRERTLVIVDFANVEKWKHSTKWQVGIQELANLVKNFSTGQRYLRRFYYGADYGPKDYSTQMIRWSEALLTRAKMNGFEVIAKRVKYIHSADNVFGFEKKCDLDVEMAIDMIMEKDNYDTVVVFSGDGDLSYALRFVVEQYGKQAYVFGARDHIGRELIDAKADGTVSDIFYAEDFEYRLNKDRHRR
jgi:uncharacterized LabA/DUF88 family protein